ncbi:VOC family protein [Mechercharimyces sp. CAU 1602]|uniref:VOC family protein n=1 Tax=Mechercharimyces sp. CAU 1602 TaxID=2973933 RepID=UPI002161387A|nr:VOC family protein [Mechercharimyces sp. CAU 1602]MCS1351457.1 VOC family protein [Mechercharimyces sp. CAU 1602]
MKIKLTSVLVDNQEKALNFYTGKLGFTKKHDIPVGQFKWLTLVSPNGAGEIELLLEPNDNPAAKTYQQALYEQGIPFTTFFVEDVQHKCQRLEKAGVKFTIAPTNEAWGTYARFDDTVGNIIQIQNEQ